MYAPSCVHRDEAQWPSNAWTQQSPKDSKRAAKGLEWISISILPDTSPRGYAIVSADTRWMGDLDGLVVIMGTHEAEMVVICDRGIFEEGLVHWGSRNGRQLAT